jgi:hypothetical protein
VLHHNKVPNLIINPSASKGLKPQRKATPELRARIIAMKLAKALSADIVEQTGASESIIQKTWKDYRLANPGTAGIPTGNRKMIDKDRYVKRAGELV